MRIYSLLYLIGVFFFLSVNAQAEVTFDSLRTYYQQERQGISADEMEVGYLRGLEKALKDDLIDSGELSNVMLFKVLNFVAKTESANKFEEAEEILKLAISNSASLSASRAFLYYKLGNFHESNKRLVEALEYYLKATIILEQTNDFRGLAYVYSKVAIINFHGLNNKIALNYANDATHYLHKSGINDHSDTLLLSRLYNLLGVCCRRLKKYEEAIYNIDQSILLSSSLGDSLFVSIERGNKAVVYYEKGDYDKAEPLLLNDLRMSYRGKAYGSALNAGVILSNIYLSNNQIQKLDSVYFFIQELYRSGKANLSDNSLLEYLKVSKKVYQHKGLSDEVASYSLKIEQVNSRLDSLKKSTDFNNLQEKYLMEKEISKLELLQKTNQLQSSHLKLRTTILVIIAFALIVVLWYVYVLRHKNRKIDRLNELLEVKVSERTTRLMEINKELDNYLYRASHDIRRPIRTLLGLNNVVKFTDDPQELKSLFEKVYDTAMNMDEMLFKLQMAYELNNTHQLETVNVYELIEDSIKGMERLIELKSAKIQITKNEKAITVQANHALLKIAIDNIMENALIYHNQEEPELNITTDEGKYYFYIHMQDNGYGIDEEYHEKIFQSYFKISNKTQGSGLGLFLANKAISFLAGEITLDSKINEGTQFTIKIPINPR